MTLKSRNRLTFAIALTFLALSTLIAVQFFLRNTAPEGKIYDISFSDFSLFRYCSGSVVISIFFLMFYIVAAGFYLYGHFYKTPSTEIVYFLLFLIGTVPETFRLMIPTYIYQNTFTPFLDYIGRALFWGKITSCFSLFLCALLGDSEQRTTIESNCFLLIIFSLLFSNLIPVNTAQVTRVFSVSNSLPTAIYVLETATIILTLLTYIIHARATEDRRYIYLGLFSIVLLIGKHLLSVTGIFAINLLGMTLLVWGTFQYLRIIHNFYM